MSAEVPSPLASENLSSDPDISVGGKEDVDRRFPREELLTGTNITGNNLTEWRRHNGSTEGSHLRLGELALIPPKMPPFKEYFKAIQKWEGRVISLSGDTFKATLSPLVGDKVDQEAEIYLEDVTPDERPFIEPGAVFYWSIGYLERPSGRRRESVLRFRRLPTWTSNEVKTAQSAAERAAAAAREAAETAVREATQAAESARAAAEQATARGEDLTREMRQSVEAAKRAFEEMVGRAIAKEEEARKAREQAKKE